MKERPILFSAPMVRAILAGTKTQTRRAATLTANAHVKEPGGHRRWHPGDPDARLACPYGQPGDRLWVREAHWWFKDEPDHSCGYYPPKLTADDVKYRADGEKSGRVWRPSIHMPRWASRITLEITGVRVERLQDISEDDAISEGVQTDYEGWRDYRTDPAVNFPCADSPSSSYQTLWESINGAGPWDANPWVWTVDFKRIEGQEK